MRSMAAPGDQAQELASTFRVLGDATRLRILYRLLDASELAVGEIAAQVGATESAVSHALRLLRVARVVERSRDGRTVRYRLAKGHIRTLLELAREGDR